MTIQSDKEVLERHIEVLGKELGTQFHVLRNELLWLYLKWNEYVEAYGTKKSRVEMLNSIAGGFNKVVQDALWTDILLHLTRLTDPPSTAGKENLSVQLLVGKFEAELDQKIRPLILEAVSKTEFARDWRNRAYGHKDLALATDENAEPLKPASRAEVKAALEALEEVFNEISLYCFDTTMIFKWSKHKNGFVSLLYCLDEGIKSEEAKKERLKDGKPLREDWLPKDL